MKTRFVVTAAAALMLLGSTAYSAFAATQSPTEQCTALEKQWNQAITAHANAPKIKTAKAEHAKGVQLCTAGKASDGVKQLELALKNLGVKPQM